MSYTMTMDMPRNASEYIERRGPRYRARLQSLIVAFVTMEMQCEAEDSSVESSGACELDDGVNVVDRISGVVRLPDDFNDKDIRALAALEKYERVS